MIFKIQYIMLFLFIGSAFSMMDLEQHHQLVDHHRNSCPFYTKNLVGLPPSEDRIRQMADILNQRTSDGQLNGHYFDKGLFKDEAWIQRRIELIMGSYDKGLLSCRFFYRIGDPTQLVCFVNAELCYFDDKPEKRNDITLAWGANTAFQGRGFTSEALRGFMLADALRDQAFDSVVLSIHPENTASVVLAQRVLGAEKSWEGMNYSKTQPRHFYEASRAGIIEVSQTYPTIGWGE